MTWDEHIQRLKAIQRLNSQIPDRLKQVKDPEVLVRYLKRWKDVVNTFKERISELETRE